MIPTPVRRYFLVVLAPVLCLPIAPLALGSGRWERTIEWGVLAVMVSAGIAGGLMLRRLRKRLVVAGGRLCLRCCYDLSGQDAATGACPECGVPYDWERDAARWQRFVAWVPGRSCS